MKAHILITNSVWKISRAKHQPVLELCEMKVVSLVYFIQCENVLSTTPASAEIMLNESYKY